MLAALGLFVFELASLPYDELQRRTEWRHPRAPRVGARDASQFVGPGDERLSLAGVLLPEVAGSFAALRTLREMADEGEAWPFVTGTGEIFGQFVLISLDERRRYMMVDGVARMVDFSIELDRVA
jgi:phage protein U